MSEQKKKEKYIVHPLHPSPDQSNPTSPDTTFHLSLSRAHSQQHEHKKRGEPIDDYVLIAGSVSCCVIWPLRDVAGYVCGGCWREHEYSDVGKFDVQVSLLQQQ